MKAVWGGEVIAEADSDQIITIEGNSYFPPDSVHREFFVPSETPYTCPWKGVCTYYTLMVDGVENPDAAWSYEEPKEGSIDKVGADFTGFVAFWRGVEISD